MKMVKLAATIIVFAAAGAMIGSAVYILQEEILRQSLN